MNLNIDLQQLRREYQSMALDIETLDLDPIVQCERWLAQAIAAQLPDASAMVLATVNRQGQPSTRVVLLKGIEHQSFIFYSHYHSHKGVDIAHHPQVALHFFWPLLERQLSIQGSTTRLSAAESDAYFMTRPRESQISAWASMQSQAIASRKDLLERQAAYTEQFKDKTVPRPKDWGGYAVKPHTIEFWQGRALRLHDRIAYQRVNGRWESTRLAP